VKLVIEEAGFEELRREADRADALAAVTLAYVEGRSALVRMRAGGRLSGQQYEHGVTDLEKAWGKIAGVPADDLVIERAALMAERHVLRAYDAVHLAAALELMADGELGFACWDDDLRAAANAEELRLVPP